MKKFIVLSVNENTQYRFYLPLTIWAWQKFGWIPIVFDTELESNDLLSLTIETLQKIITDSDMAYSATVKVDGYPTEMVAQISRLYASCLSVVDKESYIMTGDIDMIPLSDYWKPDFNEITCWGHDLAGFGHYPICYIAMMKERWDQVMMLNGLDHASFIKRDLDNLPQAKSTKAEERWCVDQDLITMRLKPLEKTVINRGVLPNGYAYGRVDRSAWTLNHKELIDCHMLRDIWKNEDNFNKTMELLRTVWPNENFQWFEEYKNEFAKLNP